jgi:RNA polymerase sigma-70 factor (ECF subfamily)
MDEDDLRQRMSEWRQAWPNVDVAPEKVVEFVRSRVGDAALDEVHGPDLYLACGCLCGLSSAIEAFDHGFLTHVPDFIRRIDRSEAVAQEVQQILRERLLVGTASSPPRIADYAGRGPLMSWLRVVAVRVALELQRSRKPTAPSDEGQAEGLPATDDPEIDYLRVRYGTEFREAFTESLAALDPRQRTILQLYLVDGLNIERIGQVYQVHRATVARWIAGTRDELYDETRRRLREKLHLDAAEFESIVRLVRSQLDVSVRRILEEGAATD